MASNAQDLISSNDPLSDHAMELLLNHREEDSFIDYKLRFENEEREWLEITKDIVSFSNTFGGYLVFGIKDGTYEKAGLDEAAAKLLSDANNIMQKINRNIEPHIHLIRSKSYKLDDKYFAIIFTPPSIDKTHMICRNASFKFPSGKEKVILYAGTTYVRRSAGNHMMDSRDLDEIINRRINYFKDSLLDKIARVIEAPQASEVFIVSEDSNTPEHGKFIVQDTSSAIPVKGMSFTVSPETTEQEIDGWIAMTSRDTQALPGPAITWKWYSERHSLSLNDKQKIGVAKYCILTDVPAFYWLRGCDAEDIKQVLLEILGRHIGVNIASEVISIGAFLGKKFHRKLISQLGTYTNRIAPNKKTIPASGPRTFFRVTTVLTKANRQELEEELDNIAKGAFEQPNQQPPLQMRWKAKTLDCHLYAQDDQYVKRKKLSK